MNPPKSAILKSILVACLVLSPMLSHAEAPYAIWNKSYNGTGNYKDEAKAIAVDASNNVIVTGTSDGPGGLTEITTVKYSATDGSILWERRQPKYSGMGGTRLFTAVDYSGNVIVAGAANYLSDNKTYSFIEKYSSADGALLWEQSVTVFDDYVFWMHNGLSLDPFGNVIIIGGVDGYFRIAKYASLDGSMMWNREDKVCERYKTSEWNGRPNSVTVDAAGNVIVCGYAASGGVAHDSDYYTAKHAAADGALLWESRFNGFGNGEDQAVAVAVDSVGNAFVTGSSSGDGFGFTEICTVKLSASDGILLWQRRSGGLIPSPKSIAVDAAGNVAVTGDMKPGGAASVIYTAKYVGANGTPMWENIYRGPYEWDFATALAMDDSGNVIIAGTSEGGGDEGVAFYIAKYGALDGAVLSEFRHNAHTYNAYQLGYSPSISLDSSGHVFITGTTMRPNNLGDDYLTLKVAMLETLEVVPPPPVVGPQPAIVIQQPPGSNLVDGNAKRVFGRVKVGKSGAARIFTITNTGASFLSGIGISLTGPHSKDFVITKPKKTTLAPGGSLSFKVSFKPKTKGARSATLKIKSNDPNGNPNGIQLSGIGLK